MPTDQKSKSKSKNEEIIDGISDSESLADQTLAPTPLDQWGAKPREVDDGFIVELPSGNVCKVRRTMDMMTMLQSGKIPNPLAKVVNSMIDNGSTDFATFAQKAEDPEVVRQLFDLLNQTMAKIFVEPKVSAPPARGRTEHWESYMERIDGWEPEPGTLSCHVIEMEDKMFVFAVAQGAAADLDRFREEQESALGALQAEPRVVKPTKRTGGARSKK